MVRSMWRETSTGALKLEKGHSRKVLSLGFLYSCFSESWAGRDPQGPEALLLRMPGPCTHRGRAYGFGRVASVIGEG